MLDQDGGKIGAVCGTQFRTQEVFLLEYLLQLVGFEGVGCDTVHNGIGIVEAFP
jgi:hypothetical protein